jgi:hypothetical protein
MQPTQSFEIKEIWFTTTTAISSVERCTVRMNDREYIYLSDDAQEAQRIPCLVLFGQVFVLSCLVLYFLYLVVVLPRLALSRRSRLVSFHFVISCLVLPLKQM